mgnify:CR=1 FL=1
MREERMLQEDLVDEDEIVNGERSISVCDEDGYVSIEVYEEQDGEVIEQGMLLSPDSARKVADALYAIAQEVEVREQAEDEGWEDSVEDVFEEEEETMIVLVTDEGD